MILSPDGDRLSKRHGALSVLEYKEEGFLPDALLIIYRNLVGRQAIKKSFQLKNF